MKPTEFRNKDKHQVIRFGVGQCSLGPILVAATDKGVCAILLGDDPQTLVNDLQSRFSQARLIGGDTEFESWMATVIGFVDSAKNSFELPVDIQGSAFQHLVWQALREIPSGSTASYNEIAKKVQVPQGARAVAMACAANPLAVVIPCHRVVRSDGALSGYRWGTDRKKELLEREKH